MSTRPCEFPRIRISPQLRETIVIESERLGVTPTWLVQSILLAALTREGPLEIRLELRASTILREASRLSRFGSRR